MTELEKLAQQLPSTWTLATLGDLVDYGRTNKAEPDEIDDSAWVLELEDIEKDSSRLLQRVTFGERQSKSTKNRFDAGDVLYGKLRPYLNKVLIADRPGFCTTEIVPIKCPAQLDTRYLFYWLKHPHFLRYVEAESHGMNMPRLGTEAGRSAPLVLAPRLEQTRVADQLDTLLARIKACNDRLDAIPGLLKRFRQAVLNAATTGALTEEWRAPDAQPWRPVVLGDVASDFSYGSAAKSSKAGAVPVLRMGNIQQGELDWTDLVYTSDPKEIEKYRLMPGDVLFNRTNSPELVGKTAVYQGERPAVYAGYLIRVRCSSALLPDFLNYCLGSTAGRDYCWSVKADGVSQSNINAKKLAAFPLVLPLPDEQAEIVRRVRALFALSRGVEKRYRRMLARAERLTPQVLAKAFCGDLLPQDPNDEPASVLLARLAAERNQAGAAPRSRKAPAPRAERPLPSTSSPSKAMPNKSRQDEDVKCQPYLAAHLHRLGQPVDAKTLYEASELPVADFYKQLAWEIAEGHVNDADPLLEPARHAA